MADYKPMLFPCARRVKMPNVGSDETQFKPIIDEAKFHHPLMATKSSPYTVSNYYLKKISSGLSFSEDVVRERCFHTLPYSSKYFREALDVSNLIIRPAPKKKAVGRHNSRGSDSRHRCHSRAHNKLTPIKSSVANEKSPAQSKTLSKSSNGEISQEVTSPFFITETANNDVTVDRGPANTWDEYLLARMSQTTSEWIVKQRVNSGDYRKKLEGFLEKRYGTSLDDDPELVKDTVSEVDFNVREQATKSKWKRDDESMLDEVRKLTEKQGLVTDPYGDDTNATFYRLPAGLRRAKKYQEKEESGACNKTAYSINVAPYQASPPPTLKDFINPKVGSTLHDTQNRFEQEWLTGTKQVYQDGNQTEILLESDNRYRKILVTDYPQCPARWFSDDEGQKPDKSRSKLKKFERGMHRWKALPEPIDDTAEKLRALPLGSDEKANADEENKKKTLRSSNLLLRMVDDWRAKWNLDMRYADATPDDLIRDMADIHPHIRLKAITTCARAAEYSPPPGMGIQLNAQAKKQEHVKTLPDRLFVALELCLKDKNLQVRRAASIALYTLEKPVALAEEILREALTDELAVDRWTAAQCLAYYGECDSEVVLELISQLLNTQDRLKHEQAQALLARLSGTSTLVHSLIGEQLNSSSWRHRLMACRVLPKFEGRISKDLVNKLTHLMWSDWHHEVRKIAAQTIGKTGHGKHIHDELRNKIMHGNEKMRVDAVSKVGYLGIMTAKLLPAFLNCFHDSYVSVRMEVCVAAGNLRIQDSQVLEGLVYLATFDPIWKVKALAIQALGTIGVVTKHIRECILWAFRYEDQAGIRVEACHTIIKFQLADKEVAQILQDRYLVETSDIVKDEIVEALKIFHISPSEDMDMVAQIKTEVRKLCTRNNIAAQISQNERAAIHDENIERMIYYAPGTPVKQSPRYRPITRDRRRLPSGDSIARVHGTSESSRPFSQEADREVQAILDRYDDDGSSHVTNLDFTIPESRTESGISQKTRKGETAPISRSKSNVTFASPEAQEFSTIESEDSSKHKFGEAQVFVEIAGNLKSAGECSEDVVTFEHNSPDINEQTDSDSLDTDEQMEGSMVEIADEGTHRIANTEEQIDVKPTEQEIEAPETSQKLTVTDIADVSHESIATKDAESSPQLPEQAENSQKLTTTDKASTSTFSKESCDDAETSLKETDADAAITANDNTDEAGANDNTDEAGKNDNVNKACESGISDLDCASDGESKVLEEVTAQSREVTSQETDDAADSGGIKDNIEPIPDPDRSDDNRM